jgi:CHAP domain
MGSRPTALAGRWSRWRRALLASCCVLGALLVPAVAGASVRLSTPGTGLVLFVHPLHGGGWSSHPIDGAVAAGTGAPSVAATKGGEVVLAQRSSTGDVTVAEGSLFGAYLTVDLTSTLGAPAAAGRPVAFGGPGGAASVWYRTTTGDLEVVSQTSPGGTWTATDATQAVVGAPLGGDPTVVAQGTSPVAYAVTATGTVVEYVPPSAATPVWTAVDPTSGLLFPPLVGGLSVFAAPGVTTATVLLGEARSGDLVELTDETAGPPVAVGAWQSADLTALGAPAATGPLSTVGPSTPEATYTTWSGDVVALRLTTGLVGGFEAEDLTRVSDLVGARGAEPSLVLSPAGPAVAERTLTGDLLIASVASPTSVSDLSFEAHTQELVAQDAGATVVGGATILVAADRGPIAPTALGRRIALLATSFDQQHRGYQTAPHNSDCNPFTASFGRGSTSGCPAGTSSEEWCSDFAQFIWRAAGVPTNGITGWSATFVTWGRAHHRVQYGTHFSAQVGDAIVWGTRNPLYGTHVAIVVSVLGRYLDVVSGNSNGDFPGYGVGVWRWGPFLGASSNVNGYHVLGVVAP